MKTAISLPDELFKEAEKYAKKQKLSRSELYAEALRDYLKRQNGAWITEAINKVLDETMNDIDPALIQAQVPPSARKSGDVARLSQMGRHSRFDRVRSFVPPAYRRPSIGFLEPESNQHDRCGDRHK